VRNEIRIWQRIAPLAASLCLVAATACDELDIFGGSEVRSDTVKLMTYNVFHDGEDPMREIAAWSERREAIIELIAAETPDVLGLQEAERWQVDWFVDRLPAYAAVARGAYADAGIDDAETVAILYLRDAFHLDESGHFWYSDTPDSPGSYGSAAFGGLTRPRMATWVRLRQEGDGGSRGFYVFNTHFTADGTADDGDQARAKSAELLVQRIAGRSHDEDAFFVLGDLNVTPDEWPLKYLLGSRCAGEADCTTEPEARMTDAWASLHPGNDAGTRCNGATGDDGPRVDYVLVWDPAPVAGSCDAGGACTPATLVDAKIVRGGSCSSDHRPVAATFVLPPDQM